MKTAVTLLKSVSPYSQSRHIDPEDYPKHEKETSIDYERRIWRERMHVGTDGNVFIPPTAFKNCLSEAAKYLSLQIPGKGKATYTKHFEAGVLVTEPLVLPLKPADVQPIKLFLPPSGKRGDGKRVTKYMPFIPEWIGQVEWSILDETITQTVFTKVLEEAGKFIGIGFFRPIRNGYYGRFSVVKVTWK